VGVLWRCFGANAASGATWWWASRPQPSSSLRHQRSPQSSERTRPAQQDPATCTPAARLEIHSQFVPNQTTIFWVKKGAWGDHPPSGVVGGGPRVTWRCHWLCRADVSPWLERRTTFFPGGVPQRQLARSSGRGTPVLGPQELAREPLCVFEI
jgi:hypothetical protein